MDELKKNKREFKLKVNLFDLVILIVCLLVASILLTVSNIKNFQASNDESNKVAHVIVNGKEIKTVELSSLNQDYELILLHEEYETIIDRLVISFSKEKGVAITEAHCKDLICKNQGYIYVTSKSIVCLPESVVIYLTSSSSGNEGWQ